MNDRIALHEKLVDILGSNYVYFQPPESIRMTYPCIVYQLDAIRTRHANDEPYTNTKRYQVTVIDKDPDSEIPDRMLSLPYCGFSRFFIHDNLNHWVFTL